MNGDDIYMRKWILFLMLAFASLFICGIIAGYIPAIMSMGTDIMQQPIFEVLKMAYSVSGTWRLAISLYALVIIVIAWAIFHKSLTTKTLHVTNDIHTPSPAGQYQHGSSRWLDEKEYGQHFNMVDIDPDTPFIANLIKHGKDDLHAQE